MKLFILLEGIIDCFLITSLEKKFENGIYTQYIHNLKYLQIYITG